MPKLVNHQGKRYGRLLVIERAENTKNGQARWLCKCDCGNSKVISGDVLKRGVSNSCGCIVRTHGMSYEHIYSVWANMKDRCTNHSNRKYPRYGGRGITFCQEWFFFKNFFRDMGATYQEGLTIERINNDGNYEPLNCKWATYTEQNRNRNYGKNK